MAIPCQIEVAYLHLCLKFLECFDLNICLIYTILCPQKVTGPSIFYYIYWKTSIKRGRTV